MTINFKPATMLFVGVAIGAGAASVVYAQQTKTPSGYVVAEVDVTDAAGFQKYVQALPATMKSFNVRTIIRGKPQALEGEPPKSFVLLEFDSAAQAKAWYDSPAYQAIIPMRTKSAKTTTFIVEGLPAQ